MIMPIITMGLSDQMVTAREWAEDVMELDYSMSDLSYHRPRVSLAAACRYVRRHYEGGWDAFVRDLCTLTVPVDLRRHCVRESGRCSPDVFRVVIGRYDDALMLDGRELNAFSACYLHVAEIAAVRDAHWQSSRAGFFTMCREEDAYYASREYYEDVMRDAM